MTSMSRTVAIGVVAALVLATLAATSSRAGTRAAVSSIQGGCPKRVDQRLLRPGAARAVLDAVQARVPRLYAHLTSMGHRAWHGFSISAVVNLREPPQWPLPYRIRGIERYFSIAERACGSTTAISSVLVFLHFPNCQTPCSESWVYATSTTNGWLVWRPR
jgi:hypothetical protein